MSMAESTLSQASTKIGDDIKDQDDTPLRIRKTISRAVGAATAQDILLFLIAFRILNALTIRTFFQPDEYFQSLEPAWQMAFGKDSGAWITWVGACCSWTRDLRANSSTGMEEPPEIRYPSCDIRSRLLGL